MNISENVNAIEFGVDLVDSSYENPRNIYRVVVYINDFFKNHPIIEVLAYYKTGKSKGKEYCYAWQKKDKLRLKSSYKEFIVSGLALAIDILKQKLIGKKIEIEDSHGNLPRQAVSPIIAKNRVNMLVEEGLDKEDLRKLYLYFKDGFNEIILEEKEK